MSNELKKTLTSRKLWVSIVAFVGILVTVLNINGLSSEQVTSVFASFGVLVIYVLGECVVDAAHKSDSQSIQVSIKSKLKSKRFWAALISCIISLLVALGCDNMTIEQTEGLLLALGSMSVYILGETSIDASKSKIKEEMNDIKSDIESIKSDANNINKIK